MTLAQGRVEGGIGGPEQSHHGHALGRRDVHRPRVAAQEQARPTDDLGHRHQRGRRKDAQGRARRCAHRLGDGLLAGAGRHDHLDPALEEPTGDLAEALRRIALVALAGAASRIEEDEPLAARSRRAQRPVGVGAVLVGEGKRRRGLVLRTRVDADRAQQREVAPHAVDGPGGSPTCTFWNSALPSLTDPRSNPARRGAPAASAHRPLLNVPWKSSDAVKRRSRSAPTRPAARAAPSKNRSGAPRSRARASRGSRIVSSRSGWGRSTGIERSSTSQARWASGRRLRTRVKAGRVRTTSPIAPSLMKRIRGRGTAAIIR